jgi:hypothetical protein
MSEEKIKLIMQLVAKQAEDHGLWFKAETAPEAYLQQELRKLHQVIEDCFGDARNYED